MLKPPASVTGILRRALPALLLLGLAACSAPPPASGPAAGTAPSATGTGAPLPAGPGFDPETAVPVALLVPTGSGDPERDQLGQSLVNAARLAQSDLSGAAIDLRVYPTGGDPARARAAAEKALAEGARIIVGPLFGQEAQAVGPTAAAAGVNVLTFSTTPGVAGGNVFLLGLTAETEADRIVAFARVRGIGSLSIFHPQSPTGTVAAQALEAAAARNGLPVVTVMDYPRSFQGIQDRTRDYAQAHASDAVALPDGGQGLVSVAAFLAYHDVSPQRTRFLGLGQWNAPATLKETALQGGWFVAPDPALYEGFASRYRAAHGTEPAPIAGIAYDGIAAIGALLSEARATGDRDAFSAANITDPQGFAGVNGVFRLRADGRIDRALAVMEVAPDGFRVLDPAPRSFPGV